MSMSDRILGSCPNGAVPSLVALSVGMVIAVVFDSRAANRTEPHDQCHRQELGDGRRVGTGTLLPNTYRWSSIGAATGLGRRPRIGSVTWKPGARVLHLRQHRVGNRSALRGAAAYRCYFKIAGPCWHGSSAGGALPVMIAIGFIIVADRLDRAVKHLQADLPRVAADGSWIRRSAQQITSLLMVIIGVLLLNGKLSVGALVAANRVGRVLGVSPALPGRSRTVLQTLVRLKSIKSHHVTSAPTLPERSNEGRISFENVSFSYPNAPGQRRLDKVSFKIKTSEKMAILRHVGSGDNEQ